MWKEAVKLIWYHQMSHHYQCVIILVFLWRIIPQLASPVALDLHMDQNVLGPQENQPIVHKMTMMILIMNENNHKNKIQANYS